MLALCEQQLRESFALRPGHPSALRCLHAPAPLSVPFDALHSLYALSRAVLTHSREGLRTLRGPGVAEAAAEVRGRDPAAEVLRGAAHNSRMRRSAESAIPRAIDRVVGRSAVER